MQNQAASQAAARENSGDALHGAFRQEVRRFLQEDYPQDVLAKARAGGVLSREDQIRSQQALQSRGWLAATWPAEYGGPGWDPVQRYVFEDELDRAGVPTLQPMGLIYVGPVIYTFGTEAQKRRWLPDILSSKTMWAQGYSEPESGSDLASLGLRADRDGDHYVLNGTKIWTSYAQWADWIFCLARTSREERKQAGISFICAEMSSPGITVHPIVSIDGFHHLNRVEFENVRVPVDQRIGEEGKGWHYATFLLQNERLSYAHVSRRKAELDHLKQLAATLPSDFGGVMADDPDFIRRHAESEIAVGLLEKMVLNALIAADQTTPAQVSVLKIQATEIQQKITELAIDLAGRGGAAWADRAHDGWRETMPLVPAFAAPAMGGYMFGRAVTIYGGATEIQKNLVWRMIGR
ncbi:acyl-CoA dehydrogenase family protein [Camelimonas sp. ID_303_24]